MWIINPRLPPSADTGSNSSGTRRSSSNTTFSCLTSLMHGPLPGGSFQLTYCGSSDARPNRMGIATFIFLPEKKKKNSKVSVFGGADSTGEAWVVSDGGSEAKSQQIHLLSPAISQRNWRQFVSSWWKKNLEALWEDAPVGGRRRSAYAVTEDLRVFGGIRKGTSGWDKHVI